MRSLQASADVHSPTPSRPRPAPALSAHGPSFPRRCCRRPAARRELAAHPAALMETDLLHTGHGGGFPVHILLRQPCRRSSGLRGLVYGGTGWEPNRAARDGLVGEAWTPPAEDRCGAARLGPGTSGLFLILGPVCLLQLNINPVISNILMVPAVKY